MRPRLGRLRLADPAPGRSPLAPSAPPEVPECGHAFAPSRSPPGPSLGRPCRRGGACSDDRACLRCPGPRTVGGPPAVASRARTGRATFTPTKTSRSSHHVARGGGQDGDSVGTPPSRLRALIRRAWAEPPVSPGGHRFAPVTTPPYHPGGDLDGARLEHGAGLRGSGPRQELGPPIPAHGRAVRRRRASQRSRHQRPAPGRRRLL
jgi:hypothetical protein